MINENNQPSLFPKNRDYLIQKYMDIYSFPDYVKYKLQNLLDGTLPESSLICCNSSCFVCENNIYDALKQIQREISAEN